MSAEVQIYAAESRAVHPSAVLREMLLGLKRSRFVAYRLALKELKIGYAKSAFGMLWDLLDPLVLSTIFYFLRRASVINPGEMSMSYGVFMIYGMLIYFTFCEAVNETVGIMHRSSNLLTHVKLAPEALLVAVFYRVGFNSLFRIAVMLGFSFATGDYSPLGIVKFLLCFPAIILAGMSIGVFLAPFNAIYTDVGRAVHIVLVPLRYISPVLFNFETGFFASMQPYNPFSVILANLRGLAVLDQTAYLGPLAVHGAVLAALGFVGWYIFHVSVPILAERA